MIKNIIYISGSVILFFAGVVLYGVILNYNQITLEDAMAQKEIDKINEPRLYVDRKNYSVILYHDTLKIKKYKAVFGNNDASFKVSGDDKATPVGEYHICSIAVNSRYHKFLQINYPNKRDAAEAFKNNYISQQEFQKINKQIENGVCAPSDTKLSAKMGLHGIGEYNYIFKNLPFIFNWTNGSAALSNEAIDEIHSVVDTGTKVKFTH